MASPRRRKSRILGNVVGDHRRGDLVHLQSTVGFGNFDAAQAEVSRLLQQCAGDGEVLVLDLLGLGQDFVDRELFGGLRDHLVLLGEIFGREDFGSLPLFQQKAAAEDLGLGNRSCGHE